MDKKQFFESLISLLPDNSGQKIDAFVKIQDVFSLLKGNLPNTALQHEFEQIEGELLSHVWMFEQVCNAEMYNKENKNSVSEPLIIISVL